LSTADFKMQVRLSYLAFTRHAYLMMTKWKCMELGD
jgi:hypothetical protein